METLTAAEHFIMGSNSLLARLTGRALVHFSSQFQSYRSIRTHNSDFKLYAMLRARVQMLMEKSHLSDNEFICSRVFKKQNKTTTTQKPY